MAACPNCGEANPAHARFCLACGTTLATDTETPVEMRKTVTIVFCDVIDSTPLRGRLDPETYRRVISRYFIEVSAVLERHGGTVEKFIGDAVMAVFGVPTVHEDDALRAVRAAAEMREALAQLNADLQRDLGIELSLRTGIATGEIVAGDPGQGQAFVTGETVVVAQRLEAAANPGEILLADTTLRLVRDAVLVEPVEPLALKGLPGPTPASRLLGVVAGAPAFARRLDSPLVGRERELTLLEEAFRRAADERAGHLFTVLGAAGVGKSRLANEFLDKLRGEASVLVGRCLPYGDGITFWPVREVVRQASAATPGQGAEEVRRGLAGLASAEDTEWDLVVERLAAMTGLGEADVSSEEMFWAARRLLETLARERPLIVAFDDLQWGEPTLLDLVEYLADWTRNAAVLIVCLGRPELLDERPAWGGGMLNATSLLLEPLPEHDVERLMQNLLGSSELADEIRRPLRAAGEGNPLFIEEMLSMLIDDGRLEQRNGGWTATDELGALEAPPTIQALLAARLDRLSSEERTVIESAAIVGKLFSLEAVAALHRDDPRPELSGLVRKDLIRPDRTGSAGEEAYRFRHILIRDAAYLAVAKDRRADLHERLAAWLEAAHPEGEREYAEIIGYHLEQAHRYRSELGPADEHTQELARRAANLFGAAGRRAMARGDMGAAASLLTRGTVLVRDDDSARLELAPDLGSALIELGELARADAVLSRAVEAAVALGDSRLEFRARLEHAAVRVRIDPHLGTAELRRTAEEAIRCFEELGDEIGLARAWLRLSDVHWISSHWAERTAALEQALVHARAAGNKRHERWILGTLGTSIFFGPMPMSDAIRRYEELLANAEGDPVLDARLRMLHALAKAAMGDSADAREEYRRSRAVLEELGHRLLSALGTLSGGWIELLAGDLEAAEAELRWGCEELQEVGEIASLSTVAAFLGRVLYLRGQYDEAARFIDVSASAALDEDLTSQVILRGTRAKLFAQRGQFDEAEALAEAGVALAQRTDGLALQGIAQLDLAEVLRLAAREDRAVAAATEAAALFARKEHEVERRQAEAWLENHARA